MDLKLCLLVVISSILLEGHIGSAEATGGYSFVFEYMWVGGSASTRNGRTPEYQIGLDVGLAVGLGFGISLCVVLFVLFYGLMCQSRIQRMDQETPHWQKQAQRQTSMPAGTSEGETYELKDASSTQI